MVDAPNHGASSRAAAISAPSDAAPTTAATIWTRRAGTRARIGERRARPRQGAGCSGAGGAATAAPGAGRRAQREAHARAARRVLDPDAPAVRLNDGARDREPEPGAVARPRRLGTAAEERLEDVLEVG